MPVPTTVTVVSAIIAAGQSLSNAVDCRTAMPVRLRMPTAWTGASLDKITFQASTDNTNWWNLHTAEGKEVAVVVLPGPNSIVLPEALGLHGGQWIKIRAGSKDNPIAQPAQRDFYVVLET